MSLSAWLSGTDRRAATRLAAYADDGFVHAAPPSARSAALCGENRRAFVASLDGHLERLQAFATDLGTDRPTPGRTRHAVDCIGGTLDHFCKSARLGLTVIEPALAMDWQARDPQGLERQARTLAIDLGAYCREVGIRWASTYAWATDETRFAPDDLMRTAGRVVIGHDPTVLHDPLRNQVDVIEISAFALREIVRHRKLHSAWRPNYFHVLAELADGRYV